MGSETEKNLLTVAAEGELPAANVRGKEDEAETLRRTGV